MRKAAVKLTSISISEEFFPSRVWQGAMRTRERASLLNEHWKDLNLCKNDPVNIYDCYPYLFADVFPRIEPALLADFSLATKLLASSLLYADKLMDLNLLPYDTTLLLEHIFAFQLEGYTLLQKLFPPDSPFWPRFRSYFAHYQRVCLLEKQFANGSISWKELDEKTAMDIAVGKTGLSRGVPAGLAALSGDEEYMEVFNESLDLYNFAHQMFDDLSDWKEDYLHQSPSLLLSRWLPERPDKPSVDDLDLLARELYYDGHACVILQLAIDALARANNLLADIPDITWPIVVGDLHERCEGLLSDILRITETNRRRASRRVAFHLELPPARSDCELLAWQALRYLIRQWQLGFGEACHIMRFPYAGGFSGPSEYQSGDIFQRAILVDILWQASQAFQLDFRPILDFEIDYLLERRCRDGIGGWSYFPDLPELSPDADDLAQVIQALLHTGRREAIQEYAEPALATLLTDNAHEDGSFETWIIPLEHRTPKQEKQLACANVLWGTGADVDVMANLLYALALYDYERFASTIQAGVAYIEAHQQANGSWSSTWYHGPYYGTYVCLRLLAKVKAASPALERAGEFLRASQRPDGSWSLEADGEGDVLGTALALSGLSFLAKPGEAMPPTVEQALHFLKRSFDEEEQAWPYCRFIRMELGRPTGQISAVLEYGSQTITTAFVLQAMVAWHAFQHD
ncbi:MAG TPA: prenyltransferase/squalene oxidase repeat-containing protein [Ktedonobacteraceae bacterium]|nr:prenyltransferase/squalene oxidase repeat-containing protein [Ktedonobacteraceae bacterium]